MDKPGVGFEKQLRKSKEKVWARRERAREGRDRDAQCMHGVC